ncbi:hypothetical protein QLH51_00965 [Sphingomonas sp. 2R-10]|uniref:hypothetical protein n=1 Tax=Sphingomonas sp. 2R-10 TaxID=3045148 RepID=UPI000F7B515F|nr:hypothetical protein [Sphingomonas sp. 2R-10]MDJ0275377.1 hypothetical protein [Sphingomonas sp. 2R-10]
MKKPVVTLLAAAMASAAAAQDIPKDPEVARLERETALLTARAARDTAAASVATAETARVRARVDALGLPRPEGKTTLGANAGAIETWMLSTATLDTAAAWIARDVASAAPAPPPSRGASPATRTATDPANGRPAPRVSDPGSLGDVSALSGRTVDRSATGGTRVRDADGVTGRNPILLLSADDPLVLDTAANLESQIAFAEGALTKALPATCKTASGTDGETGGFLPPAVAGAVLGLLKTDTDISGIEATIPDGMLIATVARRLARSNVPVILPTALIAPNHDSALAGRWGELLASRDHAKTCLSRFGGRKADAATKRKTLEAAIAAVDAFEAKQTKPDDNGRIPLARAIQVETLLADNPHVLRVHVEKGGGTLLKRANLWTALGAPAVGITGGLVVSYVLTDPASGQFRGGGVLTCRTALTNLRDVQGGRVGGTRGRGRADCSPLLDATLPADTGADR